ncbi:protein kinase [Penicillium canescens]|nr:protein kinase [Penicillium canescens]
MELSYPIDIWNLGVLVWHLCEGELIFKGQDPGAEEVVYRLSTAVHLGEIIGPFGPAPKDFVKREARSYKFFTLDWRWKRRNVEIRKTSLEEEEKLFKGKEKDMFLYFVGGMLQWRVEDRKTAREVFQDP